MRFRSDGADPPVYRAVLSEQQYVCSRAYRAETMVCGRVHITIGRNGDRLGLAEHERRSVTARFVDRLDPTLSAELAALVRRRGMAARRVAETLDPIEFVFVDPRRGRQCMVGRLEPPQVRRGELREIEFAVRELIRVS
jgi:hypothetical protein